jgi:hypothetical protein
MTMLRTLLLAAAIAAGLSSAPALAGGPRDHDPRDSRVENPAMREQQSVLEATQQGRSMSLPMLEQRVLPRMGGADYLGPEFNGGVYRFKFMRDGRVIWVDVDGQTGRIIRRSRQ